MYAGIDLSTKAISVVLLGEDGDLTGFCEFPLPALAKLSGNQALRVRAVQRSGLKMYLSGSKVVYIEQPMGRFIGAVSKLERLVGACITCVPASAHPSIIEPQTWRRTVGLAAKAPKADVEAFADYHYPALKGSSEDLHDASMVARAAWVESSRSAG